MGKAVELKGEKGFELSCHYSQSQMSVVTAL